jgi:hypothetical protein
MAPIKATKTTKSSNDNNVMVAIVFLTTRLTGRTITFL